jgi:hypothetical protein
LKVNVSAMATTESHPLEDPDQEALRVINAAEAKGVHLRLLGGLAIKLRCERSNDHALSRKYADIDLVGYSKQRKKIVRLFPEIGYSPREVFNKLQAERLIFQDLEHRRRIDVFLDHMHMCHKLEFRDRLSLHPTTIPLADLLMTKLQVVETTEREVKDTITLLIDHPVGETDDGEVINGHYIAQVCANDWGIFKTFTLNIEKLRQLLPTYLASSEDSDKVRKRLEKLQQMIDAAPKTRAWKLRAMVGEKKKWYDLPEADHSIVESQFEREPNGSSQA